MNTDKIVYYYPIMGQTGQPMSMCCAKRFWFQDVSLMARPCGEAQSPPELQILGCAVPPLYFRRKPWKPSVLSEAMERVLDQVEGMADSYIHPQIGEMLTAQYAGRWLPRMDTVQMLIKQMVDRYAGSVLTRCGEATVLLGEPSDTDWQMKMSRELLYPYLPRINRLLIYYEEIAETDIWMELGSHLDEFYYEFGLVPQLEPYVGSKCGKTRCGGMILDYCGQFRYPKIMPDGDAVYLDTASVTAKEQLLKRKTPQTAYVSPLKYLDTMVKNSYDGLVKKT